MIMDMTKKLGFHDDYDRFYSLFVKDVRDGKLSRYCLDTVGSQMATIKEIQQRLELVTDLADPFLAEETNDPRSG